MAFEFITLWQDYALIATLVVLISTAIAAIVYMLGRAFKNEKMTAWSSSEFYQALASIFIIALVIFAFGFLDNILLIILGAAGFNCTPEGCTYKHIGMEAEMLTIGKRYEKNVSCGGVLGPCHVEIAKSRINGMYDLVRFYTASKINRAGWLKLINTASIEIKSPWRGLGATASHAFGVGAKVSPLAGTSIYLETYTTMFDILTNLMLLLKGQYILLALVEKAVFPLFIVAGIILRSIFVTRKVGGLLIAIAVGLYFFYPMMIILQTLIIAPNPDLFPVEFEEFKEQAGVMLEYKGEAKEEASLASGLLSWFYREVDGQKVDIITYYLFRTVQPGGVIETTAFLSLWIFLPQIIILYTVVIFINEFSPLLGGDVGIAGLSKLL